ncbi:MAG: ATP-binding protein [Gammaproteobacteria bacterium]|nr:ATP-binding protein [Gammaproteobacteria bacterium]
MTRNVTGPPVIGDDLYGRQQEVDQLWTALERLENLLMLAPRRVGKTSLMRELHRDPRANWDVVYVDVEDARGAADLFARVMAELAQHATGTGSDPANFPTHSGAAGLRSSARRFWASNSKGPCVRTGCPLPITSKGGWSDCRTGVACWSSSMNCRY